MNDPDRAQNGPETAVQSPGTDAPTSGSPAQGFSEAAAVFVGAPVQPGNLRSPPRRATRLAAVPSAEPSTDIVGADGPLGGIGAKRALDLVIATALLIFLAPLMLITATLLVAEGRSALFVQPRVGHNRTRFGCLKFRTMRPDAEERLADVLAADPVAAEQWHIHQKLTPDPRITPLGHWLRTTSLDELPQLINVIRGDMSLVGPRPIVAPEVDGYPADRTYFESPFFNDYAGCLPGITGLWQVSGRHGTPYSERVRLDRVYARTWSIGLDLKILWRTVGIVLTRGGS